MAIEAELGEVREVGAEFDKKGGVFAAGLRKRDDAVGY